MMTAAKTITLDNTPSEPIPTLECVKARRQRREGNPTFKHLSKNIWIIKAARRSVCDVCKEDIEVGEEISLFAGHGWAHVRHAQLP